MIKRIKMFANIASAVGMLSFATPAMAATGAELIQYDRNFARGYVFAIAEYLVTVGSSDDAKFMRKRECILNAHADADTFFKMVSNYVTAHPDTLPMPASAVVLKAFDAMCP